MAGRLPLALAALATVFAASATALVVFPASTTLSEEDDRACAAWLSWRDGFEAAAEEFDALPTDELSKPDIRAAALRAKAAAVDFSNTVPGTPEHAETGHVFMFAVGAVKDACSTWTSKYPG